MYNTPICRQSRKAICLLVCCIFISSAGFTQPDTLCYNCSGTSGECAYPAASINVDLTTPCPELKILFVLDESGSISPHEDEIEAAVLAFLGALNGVGPQIALMEFSDSAEIITDYTPINQSLINNVQGYFNVNPFNGYNYLITGAATNWHSAFDKVLQIDPPDLAIFFTDGNPTVYVDSMGVYDNCGSVATTQRPEIVNPMLLANFIKDSLATHMFALGIGSLSEVNLQRISGPTKYQDGVNDISNADYSIDNDFDSLAINLRNFALQLCGSEVAMNLSLGADTLCSNENPVFTMQIINSGSENPIFNLVLRDTFPASFGNITCLSNCGNVCVGPACTPTEGSNVLVWDIGVLGVGDTATLVVQTTLLQSGSEKNAVWVSATNADPDSTNATLMVYPAPIIDLGVDPTLCFGQTVTIQAAVSSGSLPFNYLWSTGESADQITVTPDSTESYSLSVSDAQGCVDTNTLIVTVNEVVQASIIPESTEVCTGANVDLSVAKSGGTGGYSYLWSTGSTDSTITVSVTDTSVFFVTITDSIDCKSSASVTINVTDDPTVVIAASDAEICEGGNVTLTSQVSGGVGEVSYQWQLYSGSEWLDVGGGDSSVYSSPSLSVGSYKYRLKVNRNLGCEVYSDSSDIVVYGDAIASVDVSNAQVCLGGSAICYANIINGSPHLTLQWQSSEDGSNGWADIFGETSVSLAVNTDTIGIQHFRVVVLDTITGCGSPTSGAQSVRVFNDISVVLSFDDLELCLSGATNLLAIVDGGTDSVEFEWSYSVDSINWMTLVDKNSQLNISGDSVGEFYFRVQVADSSSGCNLPDPAIAKVKVMSDAQVDILADATKNCIGSDITLDAQLTGGSSALTLQWQQSPDGLNSWTDIPDADQELYKATAIDTGTYYYRVEVLDTLLGCADPASAPIALEFYFVPEVDVFADDAEVCVGDIVTMSAVPTKGYGVFTYEWSTGGTDSLLVVAVSDTTTYSVTVTDEINCSTSNSIIVNASTLPTVQVLTGDSEMCSGGIASLTSQVSGNAEPVVYQWQSFALNMWSDLEGETASSFTTSALSTGTYKYRLGINKGANCEVYSDTSIIIVKDDATISLSADNAELCVGGAATLNLDVTSGSSQLYVDWQRSDNGVDGWATVATSVALSYSIYTDTAGVHYFRAIAVDTANGCSSPTSNVQQVTVFDDLVVQLSSNELEICVGGTTQVVGIVTGGTSSVAYIWSSSQDSTSWTLLPSQTSNTLDIMGDSVSTTYYRLEVQDASSGCQTPGPVVALVKIVDDVSVNAVASELAACLGGQIILTANINDGSSQQERQWQTSANGINGWTDIPGETAETLAVMESDTGTYYFRMSINDTISGCSSSNSNTIELAFYFAPAVAIGTNDGEVCLGDSVVLSAIIQFGSGQFSYQWQQRGISDSQWSNISGATFATLAPLTNNIDTVLYRVLLIDAAVDCGSALSDSLEVQVLKPAVANATSEDATCSINNGSIELTFEDDPNRSAIEFSIDGGVNYMVAVGDDQGSIVYDSLSPGSYEVWARWDSDECPILVGTENIVNIECGTICGVVTEDVLGPVSGVVLNLYTDADNDGQADGPIIATQVSAVDSGTYCFSLVPVGNYVIVQEQPLLYNDLSDYDRSTGVFDPDGVDTAGIGSDNDIPVTLSANEVDADNDFVELANFANIFGFVLNDGDNGINNVTIKLYGDADGDGNKDGAVLDQTSTISDGSFLFANLVPGDYALEQVQPSQHVSLSDYDETPDGDGDDSADGADNDIPVHLAPGEDDDGNIFRENRYGDIRGKAKFQNGSGIPNVSIILYKDSNGDGNADGGPIGFYNTGPTGSFSFNNRPPGDYVVVETQPAGYSDVRDYDVTTGSFDPDGLDTIGVGADNDIPVTLAPNEIDSGNDFIDGLPGSICGTVLTDAGTPMSNVKIWLYTDSDSDGEPDGAVLDSVYSDGDTGNFCFVDILSGNYVLVEEQPEFYMSVSDYDHSAQDAGDMDGDDRADGPDDNIPVTLLPSEEDEDNIFIEDPFPGVIEGSVVDQLGAPISNVLIRLYLDSNGDGVAEGPVLDSFFTNLVGSFTFTGVEPNGYLLVEEQPAGYTSISDFDDTPDGDGNDNNLGANDQIPVIIFAGETDDGNNFIEGSPGVICGNVRDDRGDPLPDVLIELFEDADGDQIADGSAIAFVFSDSITGNYCFENVAPATYLLIETQPDEYVSILDFDQSIDSIDTDGDDSLDGPDDDIPVVLTPGEADTGNDFVEDPNPSMIRGIVENDIGVPLYNIEIKLFNDYNNDGLPDSLAIDSLTSGIDGTFVFNDLHTGIYVLVETQPFPFGSIADYDVTPDPDGDDQFEGADNDIPVVLKAGEDDSGNTFIDARPGAICGRVMTMAGNPISNVKIWLYADDNGDGQPDGDPLDSLFADSDTGNYCFEDIEPRDYVLVEEQPEFYNSISDYDHSIDSLDTDGDDRVDGFDDDIPVTLSPGEEDEDNIFIEDPFPGEIHGSVVDDIGSPISNVILRLYEDFNIDETPDGPAIDSTITNAVGKYQFTGVIPDGYLVIEEQPANYSSISDFDESPDGDGNDNSSGANDQIPVIIFPAEIDRDNNFVEGRPGGICGNVRDDRGVPIPNVRIELYVDLDGDQSPDGDTVAVVFSDSISGNYCFENITPSQYVLVEIQPVNYESVLDHDLSIDSLDTDGDDSGDGADNNIPVVLAPGESDTGNDFVEDPDAATISGVVENDIGLGLYQVEIKLYEDYDFDGSADGPVLDSTLSDFNGDYSFTNLYPGLYVLVETQPLYYGNIDDYDTSPDPDGDDRGQGPDNDIPVVLLAGEVDADNTFIDSRPGSICGSVFDDRGSPLSNVQLVLYLDTDADGNADGTALDTVFADSDSGNYCFADLVPGNYVVVELQPEGYGELYDYDVLTDPVTDPDGIDSLGGPDNDIPVVLSPGEDDGGNKFVDIGCPSIPQAIGDSLLNVCHGDIVTFLADEQNLGTEDYSWDFGDGASPSSAVGPGPHDVVYDTTSANQSQGANVSLTVTKIGCGIQSALVANVKVHTTPESAINADVDDLCWYLTRTFIPTENVDTSVNYIWDFGPDAIPSTITGYGPHEVYFTSSGQATVRLVVRADFPNTNCSDTAEVSFNVTECLGNIAGNVKDDQGAAIGNVLILLYSDDDLNGLPPVDENDFEDFTFTTVNGQYAFVNIEPGSYVVKELQPIGYISVLDEDTSEDFDSVANSNQTDDLIPVTVEPLVSDFNNDFTETIIPGTIEGFVFEDLNENETPDEMEGIDSVMVKLFADFNKDGIADNSQPIDSILTDTSGKFEFSDVAPASYVIVESQPDGYLSVQDVDVSEDVDEVSNADQVNDTIPLTVGAAEIDEDNYFIEAKIIPNIVVNTNDSGPGSLRYAVENTTSGDTVWFDANLAGDTIRIVSEIIAVDKNLVIFADPIPKIQVKSDVSGLFVIDAGQSVEIFNLGLMSGVSSDPAAIDNEGDLILNDIDVYRNPLLPTGDKLIRNKGHIIIRGMTTVRK